jgi:hypothetical protein
VERLKLSSLDFQMAAINPLPVKIQGAVYKNEAE